MPEACSKPSRRDVPWLTSGGGATIAVELEGPLNREDPVDASGIAGRTGFKAAMVGRAGPFSLMSGAFMAAWARSGATRIAPRRAESICFRDARCTGAGLPRSAGYVASGL